MARGYRRWKRPRISMKASMYVLEHSLVGA
jgi:hypothetical protein